MTYRLDQAPAQPFLSDADQRHLIGVVQLAPYLRLLDGGTAQVEEAQERLVLAFLPAIKRAARSGKPHEFDDAMANAMEEFLHAVTDFDLESDVPFHATVSARMRNFVIDAGYEQATVRIPHRTAERYWHAMKLADGDVMTAYDACVRGEAQLLPDTFLAVHHFINGIDAMSLALTGVHDSIPGPEERIVEAHLVAWLFTLVDDRQETILRLVYGFTDHATEEIRFDAGYPTGLDLSDAQAAHALGLSRPTVQRQKSNALRIMRDAMQQLVDDDAA